MKNIVIRVTGNNRKAVLAFLDKHMLPSHKPSNVSGLLFSKENCWIILNGNTFNTLIWNDKPTMTLKEVRELYEPKQTENEKRLQGRASMYKLKYEKCKEHSLEKEGVIDSLSKDVVYLMGLNNELEEANKDFDSENISLINNLNIQKQANKDSFLRYEKVQNELNTHKEKVTKLTQERDTHLQLNSDLRVTNTRLTDELIELEGIKSMYDNLNKKYVTDLKSLNDTNKQLSAKCVELDQSLKTNQSLLKQKYRYIAMIALLTLTVVILCVLN